MNKEEKDFWKRYVRWTLDDIDICYKHKANVGAAKLICAAVDALGSFYVGRGYENDEQKIRAKGGSGKSGIVRAGSRDAFIAFVSNYMPEIKKFILRIEDVGKKNGAELLYDHFRNGLIHEGLPGIGLGIIRKRDKRFFLPAEGFVALVNLPALKATFKQAVRKYSKSLNDDSQPERLHRWRDRYLYLKRFRMKNFRPDKK